MHGFKAHVGADATTALVEHVAVTPANVNATVVLDRMLCLRILARFLPTAPTEARIRQCGPGQGRVAAHRGHSDVGPR